MLKRKASMAIAGLMVLSMVSGCGTKTPATEKDSGSADVTIASSSDPSETEKGEDNSETTTGKESEQESRQDTTTAKKPDPDRVLFTMEKCNYAWGAHESYMIVMGDGRLYSTTGVLPVIDGSKDNGLLNRVEIMKTLEPPAIVDADYIQLLYENASKIDPNAKTEKRYVAYDSGQVALYYWTEDGTKIRCSEKGDAEYIIDDPYTKKVSDLWENLQFHAQAGTGSSNIKVLDYQEFPETVHCGYVILEENDSGKYLFKSYESFEKQAEKWGVDLSKFERLKNLDTSTRWFFVQLDIVPSSGYQRAYDALLIDGNVYSFHPSKEWKNPAPGSVVATMMDGFISVCPCGKDFADPSDMQTEDGGKWTIVE